MLILYIIIFVLIYANFGLFLNLFFIFMIAKGVELLLNGMYFASDKYLDLSNRFEQYKNDCNELNDYITDMKSEFKASDKVSKGKASISNSKSKHQYKRKYDNLAVEEYDNVRVHDCSASVCKNAENQPFKYICKYFDIESTEASLQKYEHMLNKFEAIQDGRNSLSAEIKDIKALLKTEVPWYIKVDEVVMRLGIEPVDLSEAHYNTYTFRYISPSGNKQTECDIVLDVENLNDFVEYLSEKVKYAKSAKGQRALMTSKLRESIKERDGYACKNCGISVQKEPHLLLEIDHIIPVSKGGLSVEENLQTLCWKCNRTKGSK